MKIYSAGSTAAAEYAAGRLRKLSCNVVNTPETDVEYLLLDIPSFGPNGQLRGGGALQDLLNHLPKNIAICGGNLNHTALSGYRTIDLLRDPDYLAANAYITAEAALDVALPSLSITLRDCPTLIIGWGRIGKCLSQLLKTMGSDITVAARKENDRAMISAMGYTAADTKSLDWLLPGFRLIYNTVPEIILNSEQMSHCHRSCVKIDLASRPGMICDDVIIARGLPAIHFPESSGKLIADTLLRLIRKEESS